MGGLSWEDATTRWRVVALVLGCLLALVVPYVILTRAAPAAGPGATPVGLSVSTTSTVASGRGTSPSGAPVTSGTSGRPTSSASQVVGTDLAGAGPLGEAMASCRLASLRVAASLGAADVSLSQFDRHIDAMNLLVAGKISYAVATRFWEETRVGAAQNAAEFRRSQQSVEESRSQCDGLDPDVAAQLPYGPVDQLNRCVTYVARATTALTRADAAVTTWQHHIHDMEMLRAGDITPAQATTMWRRNWHTGQRQLTAFETAAKQARAVRCSLD